ncbi:serum response factor-like [Mytilus galloprovincialis]|uniref:serum response factor-like n=1 Tax=Mytilus galloprovincialis TaxID=29158 RepID=UPI003F7CAA1F
MMNNNSHSINQPAFPTISGGTGVLPKNITTSGGLVYENIDPSSLEQGSDSEDGSYTGVQLGKKTRGRVKIKMEFIENKLRRYTTFSKRKTGIMKKAYELSTLTGTQVMLLVASETGHVYTFATRKLQPMITSDSGKALIQTCLNSPDPPPGSNSAPMSIEQRMNPTGFEETELSYAVSEEENLKNENNNKPVYTTSSQPESSPLHQSIAQEVIQTIQTSSSSPAPVTVASTGLSQQVSQKPSNVAVQIPGLPPGTVLVPPGTPLIPIQQQNGHTGLQQQGQTLYRLPNSNQIVSIPNVGTSLHQQTFADTSHSITTASSSSTAPSSSNVLQTLSTPSATAMTPGVVMYQTPQGIVYAPTTATLQDRQVFNFQQPAQPLSLSQNEGGQQYITIPVPVSMNGTTQLVQLGSADSQQGQQVTLSQPSAAKKVRK